jgi:hypothetical protein
LPAKALAPIPYRFLKVTVQDGLAVVKQKAIGGSEKREACRVHKDVEWSSIGHCIEMLRL